MQESIARLAPVPPASPHFYFHVSNLCPKSKEAYGNLPKSTESVMLARL